MPSRANARAFQQEREMSSVTLNGYQLPCVYEMTNQTVTLVFDNAGSGRLALLDSMIEKDFHNRMNINVKGFKGMSFKDETTFLAASRSIDSTWLLSRTDSVFF